MDFCLLKTLHLKTGFKNRKPEILKLKAPVNFQDLVNFSDSSNLECFSCMDKEAINYETSALPISTHLFFEKTEVKQKWQGILNDFAFKSGANKKAMKINTTLNKRREVESKRYDDSFLWVLWKSLWK